MARTSASSKPLTDHEEIRSWAEERGAHPACVRGTGNRGDVGMIRLDFAGYTGEDKLEEISWDDWLEKFDERGLALLVQEETTRGQKSNFNKLVSRETAGVSKGSASSSRRSGNQSSRERASRENEDTQGLSGYEEDDLQSSDDELEDDTELEEVSSESSRGASASTKRNRQVRTSGGRATRNGPSSASTRGRRTQSGRSRKQSGSRKRIAASRTRSSASKKSAGRKGQSTGGSRSTAKKAPARVKSSASRTGRGRSTGRKRAA